MSGRRRTRVRIGSLWIDALDFADALDEIAALVRSGSGGAIFTPNVDHVVMAERDARLRAAYDAASLALVDGMPVLWASRLLGTPLPEKVSGSDLVMPLARVAAAHGWRVYLLGGGPGTAAAAAEWLRAFCGVHVVGHDDAVITLDGSGPGEDAVLQRIRRARPQLVLVALGSPKQELWIHRVRHHIRPAVAIGVGATLDFVAGRVRRAPPWMSRLGLEWLYRLAQEPRRLWRRYLVQDPAFLWILARTLLLARSRRTRTVEGGARW